jgi:hypothetical protein
LTHDDKTFNLLSSSSTAKKWGFSSGLGGVQLTEYKRTPAALFLFFKQISKDETKQKPTNQFLAAKM